MLPSIEVAGDDPYKEFPDFVPDRTWPLYFIQLDFIQLDEIQLDFIQLAKQSIDNHRLGWFDAPITLAFRCPDEAGKWLSRLLPFDSYRQAADLATSPGSPCVSLEFGVILPRVYTKPGDAMVVILYFLKGRTPLFRNTKSVSGGMCRQKFQKYREDEILPVAESFFRLVVLQDSL